MASTIATIHLESVFDIILKQGWEVEARGIDGAVCIRVHGDGQSREGIGASFAEAWSLIIESEQGTRDGTSTEGASWAMEASQ